MKTLLKQCKIPCKSCFKILLDSGGPHYLLSLGKLLHVIILRNCFKKTFYSAFNLFFVNRLAIHPRCLFPCLWLETLGLAPGSRNPT